MPLFVVATCRPTVGKVTGNLSPQDVATLKESYTVAQLTVNVLDGYPLLPKSTP